MSVSHLLSEETIRQVAAANDIVEIIGASVPLKKTGVTLSGLCPFHREKTPSFVVTPARQLYKCFGCGAGGDVFTFVSLMEKIGFRDAVHLLAARVGITVAGERTSRGISFVPKPKSKLVAPLLTPKPLWLPLDLRPCTRAELRAVAARRGLSIEGLELAGKRGLVRHGSLKGLPAWIVIDGKRVNAQARRMDGGLWEHLPNPPKAYTLPGSRAAWPIGAREADAAHFVALVEGGPDLLAAHHFIVAEGREANTAAVAMLGAANTIPESALPFLANKRVRLFPHVDSGGQEAAARWSEQLERAGCEVDAFSFTGLRRADGGVVKDLNDLALLDADYFTAEQSDLEWILPE